MPKFSIIITFFNQRNFITDAINSALGQTYSDKEIIVVDDGSADGSREMLAKFHQVIKIHVMETNQGACRARNCGASLAEGDFLVFLDGDDILMSWALDVYARIIDLKHPSLLLSEMLWFKGDFHSQSIAAAQAGIKIVAYEAFMKKDRPFRASASAMVIDRQSFNRSGGWPKEIFPMDDHDLLIQLGYSGRTVQIISPQTVAYRVHENNSVHQTDKVINNLHKLIRKEKSGLYPGGTTCRFERYTIIGGLVFFWLERASKTKRYIQGVKLLSVGWPMLCAAILRRSVVVLRGRRPAEILDGGTYIE